jgi:hypothetical protein
VFWWIQTEVVEVFIKNDVLIWLYIISLIPTGLAARWLFTEGIKFFNYFKYKNADKNSELTQLRNTLLQSDLLKNKI